MRCYLTVVVALLFAPQPKAFADLKPDLSCEAPLNQVFSTQNEPTKITVEPSQILAVPDGTIIGTRQQVSYPEQLVAIQPPIKTAISYTLKNFWQMRVSEADFINSLSAEYRIISDGTTGSPFNKYNATSSGIQGVKSCNDKTVVVKDDVVIVFTELSQFAQGKFNADLRVCVKAKDKGCYP